MSETTTQTAPVAEETTEAGHRRETFRFAEAPLLHETGMMSMPVMTPEAPEQFMEWVSSGGQLVKVLFGDPEAGGTSLVWSRFGPGYVLPRHSHSADCLYYVTRGELRMGRTVLAEGDGFFQPADRPYTYTAGPAGVEILEFRTSSPFDMQITESLPGWGRVLEAMRANRDQWAAEAKA
ncbi:MULTISPECIES: cupin domain-containing protein [unclassified Pseudofrankia]|uniref:cupin domain-containing protein n=1 Tax=unclassified Pseudofrankia TaxID=2994372 RepID=UPI0008D9E4B6|nr:MULTISPECIES: cupin [unclassified Pseudofrankia]MDT3440673.1 cupin [Pseudofrankia sp. BMG5.37]OHV60598.1 cupin [Pseudofrankia sp. BMG5.36]